MTTTPSKPASRPLSLAALLAASLILALPDLAEAKRLGGKRSVGTQRQASEAPATTPPPKADPNRAEAAPAATPSPAAAAAAPAAAGAAAAAAKPAGRSWLGPVAGIAAGLGLAALASHLGFGEGLASLMLVLLLALGGFALWRLLRGRLAAGPRPALAGAGAGAGLGGGADLAAPLARRAEPVEPAGWGAEPAPLGPTPEALDRAATAEGVDPAAMLELARELFIRLQAAHDAGEAEALRGFMTPELFGHVESEMMARGPGAQRTEVLQLQVELLESVQEGAQHWVGVRFHGLIREEGAGPAEPFNERWNLSRPADGSQPWAIAGIQQLG